MTTRHADAYLRRAMSTEPVPAGWQTHPGGVVGGVVLDVVYQPARHDVCRALGPLNLRVAVGLGEAGFRRAAAFDGGGGLWVRDRPAAMRARLAGFRVLDGGRARGR
ncbi:MAG: hypothetical protein ACRD0G_06045 [Acidimicrobiales bacterium]